MITPDTSSYSLFVIRKKNETAVCLDKSYRELQVRYPSVGQFDKLRCDQGSEFTSAECQEILRKYSVEPQYAEVNVHEHGGTCERMNRTIQERIRSLLLDSGYPSNM